MGIFFDTLCKDNSMIFNEAYFGKTKELLAAEHQLDIFEEYDKVFKNSSK